MSEYYFEMAQNALQRGDIDEYFQWMFKHDDALRDGL